MSTTTQEAAVARHNGAERPQKNLMEGYAAEHGLSVEDMFATLASTIFPNGKATREQVHALLIVAQQYNLSPWNKEIYAYPAKGKGIVPIVGVDGWYKLISRHPDSNGFDIELERDDHGKLVSATCKFFRKSWEHPVVVTEYLEEVARNTDPWRKQPVRMLRHRAICQAARIALGISGLYEPDEGARFAADVPADMREQREDEDPLEATLKPVEEPREVEAEEVPAEFLPADRVSKLVEAFAQRGVLEAEVVERLGDLGAITPEKFQEAQAWFKELPEPAPAATMFDDSNPSETYDPADDAPF